VNGTHEQEIPLNWARRRGRPANPEAVKDVPPRIPRIARLMALAIKFQDMVDRGEVRDYADLARLGYPARRKPRTRRRPGSGQRRKRSSRQLAARARPTPSGSGPGFGPRGTGSSWKSGKGRSSTPPRWSKPHLSADEWNATLF
jgi:hypothetical protein